MPLAVASAVVSEVLIARRQPTRRPRLTSSRRPAPTSPRQTSSPAQPQQRASPRLDSATPASAFVAASAAAMWAGPAAASGLLPGEAPTSPWYDAAALLAHRLPVADMGTDIADSLYRISQQADAIVTASLADPGGGVSPATFGIVLAAGLVTSLSPCTLSVLPLTIGYIGGYNKAGGVAVDAAAFAAGLATTLALLGVTAGLLGKAYGQIGDGLPIAVAVLAIIMGLNLLEVLPLTLPSFAADFDPRKLGLPPAAQAYAAGATFALAASPCATPVLATLLGYVSSVQDPVLGGGLLLAYTTGYVTPLLLAASFTGALKSVLSVRALTAWVTPASGALLLAGGTFALLSRVVPA